VIARDPLRAAHAAALADEMLSSARHDLRNQLAIIRAAAFYLKRKVATTELWTAEPRVEEFFSTIEEHVDKASALADTKLTSGAARARQVAATAVAGWVGTAVETTTSDAGVTLRVEAGEGQWLVEGDPVELSLALRCVIENAIESRPGGEVEVHVRAARFDSELTIDVIDSGGGFGAVDVEQAMTPFFTTKPGHLGLGLSIARRICRRHHGELAVTPVPGGSSVRLTFPVAGKATVAS